MTYEEQQRMLATTRGRRFLVCRAMGDIESAIEALPEGAYSQCREGIHSAEGPFPGSSAQMKNELRNMARVLLRMVLTQNDGRVSPDKINGF